MADFQTHITTSTVLGVAYGAGAWHFYDVPAPACLLACGLCSVSGMLPDLDSEPGVPLRESIAFAASVVPMLLVHRMEQMGLSAETMVLIGAAVYLAIRFGLSRWLKWYTVHRGMFHSLPAAVIAAELGFLLSSNHDVLIRLYKAGGILLGFMSHLILDEIWSVSFKYGIPRFKKSFGTALKLWGESTWGNISCYAKLAVLTYLAFNDPSWIRDAAARAYLGKPIPAIGDEDKYPIPSLAGNDRPAPKRRDKGATTDPPSRHSLLDRTIVRRSPANSEGAEASTEPAFEPAHRDHAPLATDGERPTDALDRPLDVKASPLEARHEEDAFAEAASEAELEEAYRDRSIAQKIFDAIFEK
jgi:hypothetical protein